MAQIIGWCGAPLICPDANMRKGEFVTNFSRALNVMQWKHRLATRAGLSAAVVDAIQTDRMTLTQRAIQECPFA